MTICPCCDTENIEGVDTCDRCGQPLSELGLSQCTEIERSLLTDRLAVLSPKTPVIVLPDTPVGETLDKLVGASIGCVLIVDQDRRLLGIFSERDAVRRLGSQYKVHCQRPISEFMTPEPQALPVTAKLAFAVHQMDIGGYRHIPIVDDQHRAIGIISVRDILRYLTVKVTSHV